MRYVKRRHRLPASWFRLECDSCEADINAGDPVFCDDCCDHSGCVSEDDACDFDQSELRERARELKAAMQDAQAAGQRDAAYRIEHALDVLYPEWPGLVAP
jgi:hypothetical protein